MSLHDELTEFWYFAKTASDSTQCFGQRTVEFKNSDIAPIELPSGGDFASEGKWESKCFDRNVSVPIKLALEIKVEPYTWFYFWRYDIWEVNWLFTWMVCGSDISPVTFDERGETAIVYSSANHKSLTPVSCGDCKTECDQLFIIIRTANTFFAGSNDELWFEMFRKGSKAGMKDELVSASGFSPNRTYGFSYSPHQLPDNLSVESIKSINLETNNSDALYLTDVFVFGRNSVTRKIVVFAFSSGMDRSKQISQQEGEGVTSLEIPLIRSFEKDLMVFSTKSGDSCSRSNEVDDRRNDGC